MTVVVDASVVVSALVGGDARSEWAASVLQGTLLAPALLPFEVANVLRRLETGGRLTPDGAAQGLADLRDLRIELWPFDAVVAQVWALRGSLSAYDASYVAVAAAADVPLATLDGKLVLGAGRACRVLTAAS